MTTGPEEGPRKHKKADKQEERKFGRKATRLIKGGRKIKKWFPVSSNAKVRHEGFISLNLRVSHLARGHVEGATPLIRALNGDPAGSICTSTLIFGFRMITRPLLASSPLRIGNISAINHYQKLAMKKETELFKGDSGGRQEVNFCDCS